MRRVGFPNGVVVVFSLKGWDNIAQGNALGLMEI
jgi:hypothetical protein